MKRNQEELRRARQRLNRKRDQDASLGKLLELALNSLREDELNSALEHAQRALRVDPYCVPAYLIGSRACLIKKDVEKAIQWCLQGREANPRSAEIDCELGTLYSEQENHEKAIETWQSAINKDARLSLCYENLVSLLTKLERYEEAERTALNLLAIEPNHNVMRRKLSGILRSQQRYKDAIEILQSLIESEPSTIENYRMLAALHRSCNNVTLYVDTLKRWLEIDPANATVKHMLNGVQDSGEASERADDAYVRDVFDRFAATFDQNLGSLNYQGPSVVEKLLLECFGPPPLVGTLNALDVGCGTGLCGPKLRPYCKQLVGVDLSSEMIHFANERLCYDRLEVEELTGFLKRNTSAWDLIVAADTFNYFGDLDALFVDCHDALTSNGTLLFTLEHSEIDNVETYRLNASGRYCHSSHYVQSMLVKNRFQMASMCNCVLRREADQDVNSIVVTARKIA